MLEVVEAVEAGADLLLQRSLVEIGLEPQVFHRPLTVMLGRKLDMVCSTQP